MYCPLCYQDPANTFVLRVYGDSMVSAGIHDRDEIVVNRSIKPPTGKVIVASLNGEFTVKCLEVNREDKG